jgi:hypothetical protein
MEVSGQFHHTLVTLPPSKEPMVQIGKESGWAPDLSGHNKGKVVLVLNQAACYKDVLGGGGIAPHILNLDARWR